MYLKNIIAGLVIASATDSVLADPVSYQIDPAHTATVFRWNHFGFSNPSANFRDIQGVLRFDNTAPENSSVDIVIAVNSINTNVPLLDTGIQKKEWFDAEKYPTITFKSTKVETQDQKHFKITGDLTVKDITRPVVLQTTLNRQAEHPMSKVPAIGFDATTSFKRSEFGLTGFIPDVSDEIHVSITTEATQPRKSE